MLTSTPAQAASPPAGARPAGRAHTLDEIVDQTAAVVEGDVSDISSTYSDSDGPWTLVTLTNTVQHFGGGPTGSVTVRLRGGPVPNNHVLRISELPVFDKGKRYVVFLRNTSWRLSPVVGAGALRVEQVGGKEILVDTSGAPLVYVGAQGFGFSSKIVAPRADVGTATPTETKTADVTGAFDRNALVQALAAHLKGNGRSITGVFFDQPIRDGSKWNVLATQRPAGTPASKSTATGVEPDTSK
jgi:hypothetical protein